jgi:uncharacterized damage-inducible protein DinB
MLENQLVETWEISNRINLYLLDALDEAHLADVPASKGRSVGEQFAHLHNVRLMWIHVAEPKLNEGQIKIERTVPLTKSLIAGRLEESSKAMSALLRLGLESGKIKGFKPHPAAFLGYILSHEAHHRGQILLALKQSGHAPDKKVLYGIWEWGKF